MTDREVAEAAVRRAGALLLDGFGAAQDVERKSAAGADVVTAADRAAEAAVVEVLRAERPDDGVLGEEGARAEAERTWVVDALDGTFNYVSGVPSWCAAVALTDAAGPLACAVYDPVADALSSAARGEGAGGLRVRAGRPLSEALVSTFIDARVLSPDDLLMLVDAAGVVRAGGAGSLELAWVAAGRIDAWAQRDTAPWDWLPGALLVTEAGGRAVVLENGWHIAGTPQVVEELVHGLGIRPGP